MNNFPYTISKRQRIKNLILNLFRIPYVEIFLIYSFGKKSWFTKIVPPEYLYKKYSYRTATRDGIHYKLDVSNVIDHALYFRGYYFSPLQVFQLIGRDSVVIDVGANIGTIALRAASICTNGFVYAYEPDSEHCDLLHRNLRLNRFGNVIIVKKALGENPSRSRLFKVNRFNTGMNRILLSADAEVPYEEIEIVKLDSEIERLSLSRIDVVKIDVEGFEYNVLLGAIKTLEKFRPTLVIEVIDANLKVNGQHSSQIIDLLSSFQYQMIDLKTGRRIRKLENIETDILCYVAINPLD